MDWVAAALREFLGPRAGVAVARILGEMAVEPGEETLIRHAVPKRRAEFSTGRFCAREALKQIGIPACAIPAGPLRGPVWPEGVTGSITHSAGWCVAAVAPVDGLRGIGIDLLDVEESRESVEAASAILFDPEESVTCGFDQVLRFSAKETVIKALSETAGRWLEFTEICVHTAPGVFHARAAGFPEVQGQWKHYDRILLTAAKLLVDGT